jgi:Rps23 Pro-64 3,4-dihydroxylase Tpa1-like proline 4-hydroxylase
MEIKSSHSIKMSIIDWSRFDRDALRASFESATPFHHLVIDNFLDTGFMAQVELELRTLPMEQWLDPRARFASINNEMDSEVQSKKIALNTRSQIPPLSSQVMTLFDSDDMISFLEAITGIPAMQRDPELLGGGIHRTTTGGKLAVHADFNLHPSSGKHRRVNALLYLNTGWQPAYNGQLELWNKDMTVLDKQVEPVFNRLVIFRITDDAYHGHPNPWLASFPRLSFAFYYYTDDRPEAEKAPFHWAAWQRRKGIDF